LIQHFLESNKKQTVCEFFLNGYCKYGDSCEYLHNKGKYKNPDELAYIKENDRECEVCLDFILVNDKQFGILDGCDHCFCLKCIREWRATYDRRTSKHHFRTCPMCRKNSYLVIPSYYHVISGPDKEALIEEY